MIGLTVVRMTGMFLLMCRSAPGVARFAFDAIGGAIGRFYAAVLDHCHRD
jgi:hypothetical protein